MGVGINDHGLSITQVRDDDKRSVKSIASIAVIRLIGFVEFFGFVEFVGFVEFIEFIGFFRFPAFINSLLFTVYYLPFAFYCLLFAIY